MDFMNMPMAKSSSGGVGNGVMARGKKAQSLAKYGRNGDTEMAHVTPGEIVIPHSAQTPRLISTLHQEFMKTGVPLERYVVGSGENSMNPETGNEEHFSFKKLLGKVLPIAGTVASAVTGNPLFAMGGNALSGAMGDEASAATGGGGQSNAGSGGAFSNLPAPVAASIAFEKAAQRPISKISTTSSYIPDMINDVSEYRSPPLSQDVNGKDKDRLPSVFSGGYPEFFDISSPGELRNSRNPNTGMKEYADYSALMGKLNTQGAAKGGALGLGVAPSAAPATPSATITPAVTKPATTSTPLPAAISNTPASVATASTPKAAVPTATPVKTSPATVAKSLAAASTQPVSKAATTNIAPLSNALPASTTPVSTTPTAATATYSQPKYLNEQIGKELGYTGQWGGGGQAAWLAANPNIKTELDSRLNAAGGNKLLSEVAAPATAPAAAPASTAATSPTKIGNDGYYDIYKPSGSEVRVVGIIPGANSNYNVSKNPFAMGDDRVVLSDGRTVLASTLKGRPEYKYGVAVDSIVNPDSMTVIGVTSKNPQYSGMDFYFPGSTPYSKPAAAPVSAAPAPATSQAAQSPATATASYSTPKYINEIIGRQLGYKGDWGAGGQAAWLEANPAKKAEMDYILSQYGGNREVTQDELVKFMNTTGSNSSVVQDGSTTQQSVPSYITELQSRLDSLLKAYNEPAQASPSVAATTTTPAANTPVATAEEPAMVRVSSKLPNRSDRYRSRRYKGTLARNF